MNLSFEKSKHAFLTLGGSLKTIVPVLIVLALGQLAMAQVTVVRAGRLIDPDSGTVLTNQVIMIKDGKIQAVGRDLALPADAKWIDLSDKTVLPGLIDCHTHVADGQSDGEPFNVLRKDGVADRAGVGTECSGDAAFGIYDRA
jgi:imidazolonepropionase-like amidohydrolase